MTTAVLMFLIRALIGGILVASVPVVAGRFGPVVAGTVAVVPLITLIALAYTWQE